MNKLPHFKAAQVAGQLELFSWLYQQKAHVKHSEKQGSCYRVERQDVPQKLQKHVEQLVSLGVVVKHYKKFRWGFHKQKVCCLELVLSVAKPVSFVLNVSQLPEISMEKAVQIMRDTLLLVQPLHARPGAGIRFFLDGRAEPGPPPAVFSGQGIHKNIERSHVHVYDRKTDVGRMLLDMAGIDGHEVHYLHNEAQLPPPDKKRIARMIRDGMPDPPDTIYPTS